MRKYALSLSFRVPLCLLLSVYLTIHLSIYLSVSLSVCLSLCLSASCIHVLARDLPQDAARTILSLVACTEEISFSCKSFLAWPEIIIECHLNDKLATPLYVPLLPLHGVQAWQSSVATILSKWQNACLEPKNWKLAPFLPKLSQVFYSNMSMPLHMYVCVCATFYQRFYWLFRL